MIGFLLILISIADCIQCLVDSVIIKNTNNMNRNLYLDHQSKRFEDFSKFCLDSQQNIITALNEIDNKSIGFQQNPWQRYDSIQKDHLEGYGITGVIENGNIIEKGGVSVTILKGKLSPERALAISARKKSDDKDKQLQNKSYYAAALSIVLHSKSPMIPTFRADIRYFEIEGEPGWFGGGADLTPYYLFDDDIHEFHKHYRNICVGYTTSQDFHQKLKKWCDDYFYIPARGEHRGVGGVFFDDLQAIDDIDGNMIATSHENIEKKLDHAMQFTQTICTSFMQSYIPIIQRRRDIPYTEEQRHWQLLRRGRYIEFNMLYDRGVRFGMVNQKKSMSLEEIQECNRRTEAVFVSCPPLAAWDYNHIPKLGSEEERLMKILRNPIDWLAEAPRASSGHSSTTIETRK